ncbi:SsgA family sporulation/cell division regulator [Pengzhenrongella sicca]|uniref:SsgA family sporulation/cell division regulator n=1 Tax=Pengzhenrongella sicca TaxID=2819238 RepID=A0A8A4ZET4_9MICO|nr:SsgA family sporulation/cell division regulator [Pengzhenrongella sicca]QTE30490.1 SsgA family sporulation/cell division regulator [Pengzhenrongella sicca]
MLPVPYDVTTAITTHLVLSDSLTEDVFVELGYHAADPYALNARFSQGDGPPSTWLLARDLFAQGLVATQAAPAGRGDVRIWRDEDPDYLLMTFRGVAGEALIAAPAEPIERFMEATRAIVPFGAESERIGAAVDAFVESLLTA